MIAFTGRIFRRRGHAYLVWIVGHKWRGAYYCRFYDAWRFDDCLQRHLLLRGKS